MTIRAIRGAVQLDADTAEEVAVRTADLLDAVVGANDLTPDDVVFILFTATPDVTSGFPASAVPRSGLDAVPRMCAVEMGVAGALPLVVRLVLFAEGNRPRDAARHVYLRGARTLAPSGFLDRDG